jgi:hypothetical protein
MIPKIFADNTTIYKNHSIRTHIFCLLFRALLGIMVINGTLSRNMIYILTIFVILFFGRRYTQLPRVWKVYPRVIFTYSIVLALTYFYGDKYRHVSGTLMIVDAMLSLQSRHIFERLSYLK